MLCNAISRHGYRIFHLVVADMDAMAVQEFSRTLFSIRPDIALSVAKIIFSSDKRSMLPQVLSHISIFSMLHGLGSIYTVPAFKTNDLQPESIFVVEILPTECHLPQLSAPDAVVSALRRHLLSDTCI